MRRLGELRWRVIAGEVEVELQDQVNRSGRPRDERLPDVHTLVCLEFIRLSAQYIEVLEANGMPEGLTRGRDRAWSPDQDAAGRFILRQAHDGAMLPKLEQRVNPLLITHDRALHAVADVCFDLLEERGISRAQVIALFMQLGEQAQAQVRNDE
jgi:hypothetical protein